MSHEEAIKKGKILMLPQRRGNRMNAEVITDKTKVLGWEAKIKLKDYIEFLKNNDWSDR